MVLQLNNESCLESLKIDNIAIRQKFRAALFPHRKFFVTLSDYETKGVVHKLCWQIFDFFLTTFSPRFKEVHVH